MVEIFSKKNLDSWYKKKYRDGAHGFIITKPGCENLAFHNFDTAINEFKRLKYETFRAFKYVE